MLWEALGLTAVVFVLEIIGALAFHSLALGADAAHMFSDIVALALALVAQRLVRRPASPQHSFGWRRAEVLAAQLNGLLLIGVSVWIVYEAVQRLGSPVDVASGGLIAVATLGLIANLAATSMLREASGHNMNVRAAALHTASDAAGSAGAIAAGIAIAVWDANWADPAASIAIAIVVAWSAARLLIDTTHVLLEGTPRHLDPAAVEAALREDPEVLAVHHLHVWSLTADRLALSAHVELAEATTLHEAQEAGGRLKAMLEARFGVGHSTLELECHYCEIPEEHVHSAGDER